MLVCELFTNCIEMLSTLNLFIIIYIVCMCICIYIHLFIYLYLLICIYVNIHTGICIYVPGPGTEGLPPNGIPPTPKPRGGGLPFVLPSSFPPSFFFPFFLSSFPPSLLFSFFPFSFPSLFPFFLPSFLRSYVSGTSPPQGEEMLCSTIAIK